MPRVFLAGLFWVLGRNNSEGCTYVHHSLCPCEWLNTFLFVICPPRNRCNGELGASFLGYLTDEDGSKRDHFLLVPPSWLGRMTSLTRLLSDFLFFLCLMLLARPFGQLGP